MTNIIISNIIIVYTLLYYRYTILCNIYNSFIFSHIVEKFPIYYSNILVPCYTIQIIDLYHGMIYKKKFNLCLINYCDTKKNIKI